MERQCTKCKAIKDFEHFHKCSKSKIGIREVCKPCRKAIALDYRDRYGDTLREKDNSRPIKNRSTPVVGTNKYRARYKALNAINSGKIKRLSCEVCGEENTHAHHDDYNKPFNLRFLCPRHHRIWHIENGEARNS
jgi:hypothetical protein